MPDALANSLMQRIIAKVNVHFREIVKAQQERDLEIEEISQAMEERLKLDEGTPLPPSEGP